MPDALGNKPKSPREFGQDVGDASCDGTIISEEVALRIPAHPHQEDEIPKEVAERIGRLRCRNLRPTVGKGSVAERNGYVSSG